MLAAMVWLGPILALASVLSYFEIFATWPVTRDVPWLNLIGLAAAVGLSVAGLARSRRRAWAALGLVLTLFFGWIFVWYCYVFSSRLPGAELALDVGAAVPAVSLLDERGRTVELEPLARGKLVLVFFRGHW